jgi:hypothetical protein
VGTSENPNLDFDAGKVSRDSSNIESSKYNFQPRRKGVLVFPMKMVGGLGFLYD